MLKNLKKELTKREKTAIGGFFYGMKIKSGFFFPLSGIFITRNKEKGKKNA